MFTFNCKGRILVIDKPLVMGIINTTPDSFYEGSRAQTTEAILQKAEQMLLDGASVLDIGGQSTKPGSAAIGVDEEMSRVIPAIRAVAEKFPASFISVDTYYAAVAAAATDAGAVIVNDISGGTFDSNMLDTVGKLQVPYIIMHTRGTPATMQQHTAYNDMLLDILEFFIHQANECSKAGIRDIVIDPGFGFAKNVEQNFTLLKHIGIFKMLQRPIMAGLSRKATVYKTLVTTPAEALNGTTTLNTLALQNGASILRVHDVKEAVETIRLWEKYTVA